MKLEDVAKKAGVSLATVSRVINNAEFVKNSTRAKVLRACKELNYHPNLHARSLAGGNSRTIGMIVSNFANPFFQDIYRTVEGEAHRNGYQVLIANTGYDVNRLNTSIRLMLGNRVAGLAVIVSEMTPTIAQGLTATGIPAVLYDVGVPGEQITNVRVNYRSAMRQLIEYLHSVGHRRMAYIGYPMPLQPTEDRRESFLETTGKCGIEARALVGQSDGFQVGREGVRELMCSGFRPTAILCVNDITAVGALRELRDEGVSVPGEISVTGFDNIALAEFSSPSLTTVNIPRERVGRIVAESLMQPSMTGREIVIDPELVVRESTGRLIQALAAAE